MHYYVGAESTPADITFPFSEEIDRLKPRRAVER